MSEKLDLEALEATAVEADGGPWWKYDDHDIPDYQVLDAFHHLICSCGNDNGDANNAAHIAAFDPLTALAMIAEIRELRTIKSMYDAMHESQQHHIARAAAAEARVEELEAAARILENVLDPRDILTRESSACSTFEPAVPPAIPAFCKNCGEDKKYHTTPEEESNYE